MQQTSEVTNRRGSSPQNRQNAK